MKVWQFLLAIGAVLAAGVVAVISVMRFRREGGTVTEIPVGTSSPEDKGEGNAKSALDSALDKIGDLLAGANTDKEDAAAEASGAADFGSVGALSPVQILRRAGKFQKGNA